MVFSILLWYYLYHCLNSSICIILSHFTVLFSVDDLHSPVEWSVLAVVQLPC